MIDQEQFSEQLATILTPLQFRNPKQDPETEEALSPVNIAAWYETPGITVAASQSTAIHASQDPTGAPEIRHAAWGARELPDGPYPDEDTIFQACSISKAFQSIAVLCYISEGVIKSLDDPAALYLPPLVVDVLRQNAIHKGIPEGAAAKLVDRTTILGLLSHTAGTTGSGYQGYPTHSGHITTPFEILEGGLGKANSPAVFIHGIPGVQFEYSGGGSTIIQAMLEEIIRREGIFESYAAMMKAKVLDPLQMMRSFYCDAKALPESEKNFATGYHNGAHPLESGPYNVHPEQGTAGLWTTSKDLVKGVTGFVHTILGTSAALKLNGEPWIRPDIARQILRRRSDLAHGGTSYYCGFAIDFFDGEEHFPEDKNIVRISHSGGNYGYRCWAAATFPLPDKLREGEKLTISAMATMTNSNYGGIICPPMLSAVSSMLDSPLGGNGAGGPYSFAIPGIAVDPKPSTPSAGWKAYEGKWELPDRTQHLEILMEPEPCVVFSHLEGINFPFWAVADRKGDKVLSLRVGSLDVVLNFGWNKKNDEILLTLCTGEARIKCVKK